MKIVFRSKALTSDLARELHERAPSLKRSETWRDPDDHGRVVLMNTYRDGSIIAIEGRETIEE